MKARARSSVMTPPSAKCGWAFTPSYVATGVPARARHAFCRPDTSRHKTTRRMFSCQEPCRARDVARPFSMARVSGGAPQTVRTARVISTQEACLRCDGKLQDGCAVVWYGTDLAWCSSVQDRPAGLLHMGAAWRRCQGNIRSDVRWGTPVWHASSVPAGRDAKRSPRRILLFDAVREASGHGNIAARRT